MEITINKILGAFSGAILGDNLVCYGDEYCQKEITDIPSYLIIALTGMNSITSCYEIEQKSWLIHLANENTDYLKYKNSLNLAQSAIVLSPIIFYRYDNSTQLNLDSQTAIKLWLKSDIDLEVLTLWTLLIKTLCQRKIDLSTDFLSIFEDNQVNKRQKFDEGINVLREKIIKKESINQLEAHLSKTVAPESLAIFQAIYSFLSLPDDFHLSLKRSTRFSQQTDLTSILTGFLLGLNNGYLAISSHERIYLQSQNFSQQIQKTIKNFWLCHQGHYLID